MTKVVYNRSFGVFGLSMEARKLYSKLANIQYDDEFDDDALDRNDRILTKVLEALGTERASGPYSKLAIAEFPDGSKYRIDNYDGRETVMVENLHDSKRSVWV